MHFEKKSPSLI